MFSVSPAGDLTVLSADDLDEVRVVTAGTTLIHLADASIGNSAETPSVA